MGGAFDFTALTEVDDTVREEILEELPPKTVAEGVRELDSDDAVAILEDLSKSERVTAALNPGQHCAEGELAWEPDSKELAFFSNCGDATGRQEDLYL